jgi:hypothetical protein
MKQTWQWSSYEYCFVFWESWVRSQKVSCPFSGFTRGNQKVPGILWHRLFDAPWFRTAWTVLLVISTCKLCRGCAMLFGGSGRQGQWFLHRLLYINSCHRPTAVLSGSRSEWPLAVLCSEGHQIQCGGRTLEDSERSFPPVLRPMITSMEEACAFVCVRSGPNLQVIW